MYDPPNGLLFLAWHEDELAGGVGLRMLDPTVCEMKRLYVYDQFKNKDIGRKLCIALIQEARNSGYEKKAGYSRRIKSAIGRYKRLGFKHIEPSRFSPGLTTKYMELCLR